MTRSLDTYRQRHLVAQGVLLVLLVAITSTVFVGTPPFGQRANAQSTVEARHGAGLVVQHEDGRVIYVYVPFIEDEITGADLLARAGLDLVITPFAGLGQGVCSIDHEGCPLTNCYCQSYANPARYWRYFRLGADGQWISLPIGPSSRKIQDGDVDGWVWGPSDQPPAPTTLAEIVRINGVRASGSESATQDVATPDATVATPPLAQSTMTVPQTPLSPAAEVRAVQVDQSGQITPVEPQASSRTGPDSSYLAFAAVALVAVLVGVWVALARRRISR